MRLFLRATFCHDTFIQLCKKSEQKLLIKDSSYEKPHRCIYRPTGCIIGCSIAETWTFRVNCTNTCASLTYHSLGGLFLSIFWRTYSFLTVPLLWTSCDLFLRTLLTSGLSAHWWVLFHETLESPWTLYMSQVVHRLQPHPYHRPIP